jgi:allantoate deiminase
MATAPIADREAELASAREVIRWCRRLAECSEEPGCTTRTFLSPPMREVHAQLARWMRGIGMTVGVDAAGNLRGTVGPGTPGAARLYIGSHLDTVRSAGAFDGVLGVVLAIALVEGRARRPAPFEIEVVGFSEEEGVRFGVPFIGSRALVGTCDEALLDRRDTAGRSVRDALGDFGLNPALLGEARVAIDRTAYVEFHIEQGPVLERLNLPVGVVDAIGGQSRLDVTFSGAARHAGTTPMSDRRDALAGAAEWVAAVERHAVATAGLVATVGRIATEPGTPNVIAGRATASLDVRHAEDAIRTGAVDALVERAAEIATRRGLSMDTTTHLDRAGVAMDAALTNELARAVERTGVPCHRLTSGAGHDAMVMASAMPAAMLFLRSPGGISHHPDEDVLVEDVAAALAVGQHFLEQLSWRTW